jgi:hypothetical protein
LEFCVEEFCTLADLSGADGGLGHTFQRGRD